jgi:putative hydrolase of the HAD superfamily
VSGGKGWSGAHPIGDRAALLPNVRVVLLDALGTLVRLLPPAPRLRAAMLELGGIDVGDVAAERGFRAEISHYLAHHIEGGDREGLERLRDDCAAVMHEALGHGLLDRATVRRAMLESLELAPFPDVVPALRSLRERGLTLVVVSNWDCSLPDWLGRAGVGELVDGVVSSAVVGEPKPAPAVFRAALELAGATPGEALHVGDSVEGDVEGARAAGVRAVLLDRSGQGREGVTTVTSLEEVASLL